MYHPSDLLNLKVEEERQRGTETGRDTEKESMRQTEHVTSQWRAHLRALHNVQTSH